MPGSSGAGEEGGGPSSAANAGTSMATEGATSISNNQPGQNAEASSSSISNAVIDPALMGLGGGGGTINMSSGIGVSSQRGTPVPDTSAGLMFPGRASQPPPASARPGIPGQDDEAEGDDEFLPAMADDDYSAQLSWQSQSKDNLKVLMDNLSPAQYDRFEAYRRHALPKQAVRKVIQQTLGQQVSQPVAQIIAGFSKVFVGEIIEKARAVQVRRGETGPLSPDHLREAYRGYQEETGHVGAARPLRAKKLFVR